MSPKSLVIARPAVRWVVAALAVVALAGCGAVNVHPTPPSGSATLVSRGRVDSPLTSMRNHLGCIRAAHLRVEVLSPTKLQVGAASGGPTVVFTPTAGAAQAEQIAGTAQGAEVIGTALVYPNQASDKELTNIEDCLDQGVQG
jgi:hypothetical protein